MHAMGFPDIILISHIVEKTLSYTYLFCFSITHNCTSLENPSFIDHQLDSYTYYMCTCTHMIFLCTEVNFNHQCMYD